jgi:hypothetical protein
MAAQRARLVAEERGEKTMRSITAIISIAFAAMLASCGDNNSLTKYGCDASKEMAKICLEDVPL